MDAAQVLQEIRTEMPMSHLLYVQRALVIISEKKRALVTYNILRLFSFSFCRLYVDNFASMCF